MNTSDALTGTVVGGYRLDAILSHSGTATMYRAHDESRGFDVAFKALPADSIGDRQDVQRFEREAELAAGIDHPNVVRILASGCESGVMWTAMELVEGESLRQRLQRDGRLSVADAIAAGRQVLAALVAVHGQGVLHRDVRAENVIIAIDGAVCVLDFGTAKTADSALTRTEDIIGTVEYMAPEQMLGDPVGPAADMYAAGVLLFELLTGELPFTGASPAALVYNQLNEDPRAPSSLLSPVPRSLDQLVLRLLDKLPDGRVDAATALRQLEMIERRQELAELPDSQSRAEADEAQELRTRQFRPAFVGRDAEMDNLVSNLDGLADGGRALFIAGEAGVGKTRLVEEFNRGAQGVGARCLSGACFFDNRLGPYMPFMDILGELFSLPDDDLSVDERSALEAQLQEQGAELAELARSTTTTAKVRTGFAAALGSDGADEGARLRFFDAIFDVLRTAALSKPLVLVIEDAHWSDEGSLSLLRHFVQRVAEAPILLLVSYRPEELAGDDCTGLQELLSERGADSRLELLELQRLPESALLRLAESLFFEADFGPSFSEFLFGQSQGNPFIAIEVLKLLRSRGVLFCENGLWRVDPGFAEQVIPERVNALMLRRIDLLANDERELLQLAAVIGQRFTTAALEASSGMPRLKLLKLLFRLEKQHRLIDASDGTFEFTHAKIREVLYEEIPWELRREYHRSVATVLSATDRDNGQVGSHLYRGESFDGALPYLEQAAIDARRLFSWREAALLFDQTAEACRQTDADVARLLRALRSAGRCYANLTAYDEASERMTQMQAVAVTAQLRTDEADAVTQMGWVDLRCGRFDDASTACRHASDLVSDAADAGARAVYGQALMNWGVADFEMGRYAEAEQRWREAQQVLQDNPEELSSCLNNQAVLATVRGELDEAWELFEQVLEVDRSRNAIDQMPLTYLNMSMLRSDQERWDEALELGLIGIDLCQTSRMFAHEPMLQLARGEALIGSGEPTLAQQALDAARRGFRRLEDTQGIADVLRLQGRLCRQQGRWDESREALDRSIEINRQFGESVSLGEALYELAELHRATGAPAAAEEPLAEAEGIFVRAEARPDLERVQQALEELHSA